MSDLVVRLRAHDIDIAAEWKDDADKTLWVDTADALIAEAADEIDRLRAAIKQVEDYHRAKSSEIWEVSRDGLSDDQKKEYGIAWCVHAASAYAIKTLITPEATGGVE